MIAPDQEDELRAFANLVARRRPAEGELSWALERFELAAERGDALRALTDNLLALRALLEPVLIPELGDEIEDLDGLAQIGRYLGRSTNGTSPSAAQ